MASSYSPLKVELIGTGEQAGTWGTTTNTNLGTTLEEAITGRATATFPSDADYTLPYIDSNSSQVFRNLVLNVTSSGNLSSTRNLIIPAIEKQYLIENNTSGSQSIVVKTAAGSGITVPNGRKAHLFCDGTTTRFADDFVDINGGAIDGTPIGAASASTGAFSTATITTATVTTGNITTGNITTGNINTLNVGTQTNKATISYTTDAARTLTVPAVSGNRTFAFLEEAQTFTANQTIGANMIFTGNQRRFQAKFDSQNIDGFLFQHSIPGEGTSIGVIPAVTSVNSDTSLILYSSTDPANSNYFAAYASPLLTSLTTSSVGTGTTQEFYFFADGLGRLLIEPSGEIGINSGTLASTSLTVGTAGTRTYSIQANGQIKFTELYGQGTGATFRSVYVDNTGLIGGISSTRESKTNITPISNADWLMSLEPVSYNRRERDEDGAYTETFAPNTEFGLIADDVAEVRPEVCVFVDGKVSGINYEQLIAPMLKEIQKLRAEVNALKEKVNG